MLVHFHNIILLLVVGLYLLLNYGFMQVRVPPLANGGIPIGELMLLFSLAIINYGRLLPRLAATIFLVPFLVWWALGFGRAIAGVPEHGLWALRDATHVIESLFLIVGFVFAARPQALEMFFRWLPKILIIVCIYALGYPFHETLQSLSLKLTAGAGHEVPLFFNYIGTSSILLLAVAYLMLFAHWKGISGKVAIVVALLLLGYTAFLFQARTIYLQIIAIALLFSLYRRELFGRGLFIVSGFVVTLALISLLGLQIEGRLGQTVSFEFLVNHFLAIGGVGSSGLEGSAEGFGQRLDWWLSLYDRWTASIVTFLFGLGYGIPLVDFIYAIDSSEGVPIREPHNSYVSIVARIGLIGALAFVWVHFLLLKIWHRAYAVCTRMRWREWQNRLLITMVFFVLVWVMAIGEDAFEKPFFAIPYYFFWGIVLQMYRHLNNAYSRRDTTENTKGNNRVARTRLPTERQTLKVRVDKK